VWVAWPRAGATWRVATVRAAAAAGVTALLIAPYIVNCVIKTGDPLIAMNYHTHFYQAAEGVSSVKPPSAAAYVAGKFREHPVAETDTALRGLFVYPFTIKWHGFEDWIGGAGRVIEVLAAAGLLVWLWHATGRLLLVVLVLILWEIGGKAWPGIREHGLSPLTSTIWDTNLNRYGFLPEIWGTLYSSLLALLIGGFFGVVMAIFLTQDFLPPRLAQLFRTVVELLAAIPSVVYGLWGLFVGVTVVLILSLVGLLLTEAMSNSAVVALLMPVSLGIAQQFGMDPRVMALVIAVPAGLGYTLPIGTPANAIAYSSGHLSIRDFVVPGIILAVSTWVLFNLLANFYWPLLGISIEKSYQKLQPGANIRPTGSRSRPRRCRCRS
jgi:ABC-type spermidine/putrescine transport system permease subunit II